MIEFGLEVVGLWNEVYIEGYMDNLKNYDLPHKDFLRDYQFLYARNGLEALEALREHADIEIALVDGQRQMHVFDN